MKFQVLLSKYSIEDIKRILLLGVAVSIPLSVNLGNIAIITSVVFNLIFLNKKCLSNLRFFSFLFPILFFFIVLVWAAFNHDFLSGISRLDRHLVPILLTVIFLNLDLDRKFERKVLLWFSWSVVISASILLLTSIIEVAKGISIQEVTFHSFTRLFDHHPVYYSLMASVAIFFFMEQAIKNLSYDKVIAIGILLLAVIFSASKAVLFIDLSLLLFFVYRNFKGKKNRILFLLGISLVVFSMFNIGFLKQRFVEGLSVGQNVINFEPTNNFEEKKQFDFKEKEAISDLDLRLLMAQIGTYHIAKDSRLLTGYGPALAQKHLDYYLFTYNLGPNWFEGLNAHNQFLHILLNYGVLVLFIFIIYLVLIFKEFVKYREFVPMAFLCATIFVFLFEVVLIRNKGIVFFYFFTLLFLTNSYNIEGSNLRYKGNS